MIEDERTFDVKEEAGLDALMFVDESVSGCSSVVCVAVRVPFTAVVPLHVEVTSVSTDCSELSLDLNGVGLAEDETDATGTVVTPDRILRSEVRLSSDDVAEVDCIED